MMYMFTSHVCAYPHLCVYSTADSHCCSQGAAVHWCLWAAFQCAFWCSGEQ